MLRRQDRSPEPPTPTGGPQPGPRGSFDRSVSLLKKRLIGEATSAIAMLESALDALWKLDAEAA